ncbi:sulfotransferase family protein [Streptomyces sp. NPDC007901]|uniref:sulfotransferase family protein n=1 Tax=Streptomyces sp. NPDC007901 TaxID=3364785 RepID=UPI0036EE33CA
MKIIGAGLPRTATLTQKIALEMLGFGPCYHMVSIPTDHNHMSKWISAYEGDPDWEAIFSGFSAAVDYPASFYYRELAEAYPEAKVLLSVRDGHSWARSIRDTIWGLTYGDTVGRHLAAAVEAADPDIRRHTAMLRGMYNRAELFGPNPEVFDEDVVAAVMERHIKEVRAHIPAERLLEWSPKDGWEPLCAFLDVPVPETPLPHVNSSAVFNEQHIEGSLHVLQKMNL